MSASPRLLLALDTSGDRLQAGLWLEGNWLWRLDQPVDSQRTHSSLLIPQVQGAFTAHELTPDALTHIAVNIGPGSFTGIRAGVTVVRTLGQWMPDVEILPVDGFRLWLAGWSVEILASWQTVGCCLNARRGNAYVARYTRDPATGNFVAVEEPQVLPWSQAAQWPVSGWLADSVFRPEWQGGEVCWLDELPPLWSPQAMADLASNGQIPAVDWQAVFPLYLQPPNITLKKTAA